MRPGSRRIALLALPVLCCAAHAVLLAAGVGSVTALVGGAAGSVPVAVSGLLVVLAAAVAVRRRRRAEPPAAPGAQPAGPAAVGDAGRPPGV